MIRSPEQDFNLRIKVATALEIPIAGSVGRYAILGEKNIDHLRADGTLRDIDVVSVPQNQSRVELLPAELIFDKSWFSFFLRTEGDQTNLIFPAIRQVSIDYQPKVVVSLPNLDEILRPKDIRVINEENCLVLADDVQLKLDTLLGDVHPKNLDSIGVLKLQVDRLAKSDRTDSELLQPFDEYKAQVQALWRRKFYRTSRNIYHRYIPTTIKQNTLPAIKKLARRTHAV